MTRGGIIDALQRFSTSKPLDLIANRPDSELERKGGFDFSDAPPVRKIDLHYAHHHLTGMLLEFGAHGCYRVYRLSSLFGKWDSISVTADSPHTYGRGKQTAWGHVSALISGDLAAPHSVLVDRHCVIFFELSFTSHKAARGPPRGKK